MTCSPRPEMQLLQGCGLGDVARVLPVALSADWEFADFTSLAGALMPYKALHYET